MVGIIVVGHGNFASGMQSAVELIGGEQEETKFVNFVNGMNIKELKEELEKSMEEICAKEVLLLTDLVGGTPFNTACLLLNEATDKKIRVIAGTNLGMILEASFSKEIMELDELAESLIVAGKDAIADFASLNNDEEVEFEDGL